MTTLLLIERKLRRKSFKALWKYLDVRNWNDFVSFVKGLGLAVVGLGFLYVIYLLLWMVA